MMELKEKQISYDSVYDRIPPLSSKYLWLIAQNLESKDDDDHHQIFYTIHNPSSQYRCRIPELIGRRIQECYHGWLILCSHPDMVMWSLWNPITSRLIHLPPLMAHEDECDIFNSCLSSHPDDPSSILLLTVTKKPIIFFCRLDCETKKLRWTKTSYAEQLKQLKSMHVTEENGVPEDDDDDDDGFLEESGFLEGLTCCNGKVYAMTWSLNYRFVLQIDINAVKVNEAEMISLLPIVSIPSPFRSCSMLDGYMRGFSTELLYIDIGYEDETKKAVEEVFIFKLDVTSNTMWEEIEDLKGAMFATTDSLVYNPEIASELGGYLHIILDETSNIIYSYNVKSRTVLLSSTPPLLQTRRLSAWTVLECSLGDHQQGEDMNDKTAVRDENVDFYSTTDESHLPNIPFDVLQTIMELCVGLDYMNFRAACKCCHLAAPPIQWSEKTALRRLQTYSLDSPWLTVFDKNQGIITFTDVISSDNYFIKTPPELLIGDFQICCSRYGWLLMLKHDGPMVFYNPFTSDIRKFPQAPFDLESYSFSAPPTAPICIVAGFAKFIDLQVYIYLLDSDEEWGAFNLDFGCHNPYSFHFPTFHGQDVYALCDDGGIHAVRKLVKLGSLFCFIAEPPRSCCKTPVKRFLAACDQHIIQVVMDELGESVELFKLNDSKKEWEKIYGLGKHMIYVSGTTCLCVEARTPEMENKIYFPRLRSKKIVFYSLETCKHHTFNGKNVEESFADFFQTEYHTNRNPLAWIQPHWSS